MPKSSGLGDNFYVTGYDLSGDINALGKISGSLSTLDVTGVDKSAHERLGGKRDGEIDWVAFFNADAGQAHPVLSALPRTDTIVSYFRGTALGSPAASLIGKQINYDGTRDTSGNFTFACAAMANGFGLDWGVNLTAGKRTDTTATAGTTVDQTTVSTAFGWQAHLHVFSVVGTSVTVTLEDSASSGSGFASLTGGAFAAATPAGSPQAQRLQGGRTATVRRYVRATTSGTFTSAVFAVVFTRNLVAVSF